MSSQKAPAALPRRNENEMKSDGLTTRKRVLAIDKFVCENCFNFAIKWARRKRLEQGAEMFRDVGGAQVDENAVDR